jgi:L-asparaginase II
MPVAAMARGVMNLIAPPEEFDRKLQDATVCIVGSMLKFPELIGGNERLDTMLMQPRPGN